MRKQFWIMVKQLLLYLLLDQGIAAVLLIPFVIYAKRNGYDDEALDDYLTNSSGVLCAEIVGCIITIAVFLKKRYIRFKPGRIARSNYWKAAGFAMLISWGWMFTEASALQLSGFYDLFPEEAEYFEELNKMLSNPLALISAGILIPITEEIAFRGILVGGMLRMRLKPWMAIVLSALIFALAHGTYTQFLGTSVFGIICGWLYWRTKSLLPGVLIHITNNSTAFFVSVFCDDPNADLPTKLCLLYLVIFPPMLAIGLKWYKQKSYL